MTRVTFKQFNDFQLAAGQDDEHFAQVIEEGWFKSDDARAEEYKHLLASKDPKVRQDAERGLALLVKKGNNKAKQVDLHWKKVKAQREADARSKEAQAQAANQAADQGSSKAWRDEQGSVSRGPKGSGAGLNASDFNARGKFTWGRGEYNR